MSSSFAVTTSTKHDWHAPRPHAPEVPQWLSVETHLPHGRATPIRDAVFAEPAKVRRRLRNMATDYFGATPYWTAAARVVDAIDEALEGSNRLCDATEASTRALLDAIGWRGRIVHAGDVDASTDRNRRLADLTRAVGARRYVCGTGRLDYIYTPVSFALLYGCAIVEIYGGVCEDGFMGGDRSGEHARA